MFKIETLKTEQRQILDCLIRGKDCVAVLPTGYGKSLPYQMYLPVMRRIGASPGKVLVCCPLVSLMDDQVKRLSDLDCISAAYAGSRTNEAIRDGSIDLIFASPETLVGDRHWREQELDVSLIVVVEFHTIATWSVDDFWSIQKHTRPVRCLAPNCLPNM
ncbi:uncharacterized protein LOC110462914 [Mizuhopecten yessoensis]|nr:uncharacterized protein LOC110462914 [Mizuhopecten yessoensis]